jgi:hypothetical protein
MEAETPRAKEAALAELPGSVLPGRLRINSANFVTKSALVKVQTGRCDPVKLPKTRFRSVSIASTVSLEYWLSNGCIVSKIPLALTISTQAARHFLSPVEEAAEKTKFALPSSEVN